MQNGFLKTAAITPKVKVGDVAYNVEQICRQIDSAADMGAKVMVFPELCITGYSCGDLFFQQTLLNAAEEGLVAVMRFTAGHGSDAVVFVGLPMEMDGKLYNVAAAIQSGHILALIPKRNIPSDAEHDETRYFAEGNEAPVPVEIHGDVVPFGTRTLIDATGSIDGLMIGCEVSEDARVADAQNLSLCQVGVTLMVNLAASPETVAKDAYRRQLIASTSARLIAGYVYASAGEGESTTDDVFAGSRLICENGEILAAGAPFTTGVTISEIDLERLRVARRRMSTFHCRACADDTYHRAIISFHIEETSLSRDVEALPFVPRDAAELSARAETVLTMQAYGLKKRLSHTGSDAVFIGVSGGLDSTLALLVACRAFDLLGYDRKKITGVTMPCFGTTDRTYQNACALTKALGATLKEIDIKAAVSQHLKDIEQDENKHDVAYENAQARERTQVLMDLANQTNGLVVGTGDLSELALGWCTYNGDQTSMYGVNAGVPKTLIKRLVAHEARRAENEKLRAVLNDILDTPVSPELKPAKAGEIAQKTEEIVGPYELHDFFIYYALRFGFTPRKIFRLARIAFANEGDCHAAYDRETIKRWLVVFYSRFFAQQFKRSNLPDGVRIGSVSLSPRGAYKLPSDAVGQLWIEEAKEL